jgi:glycosyltransferase involved in cell wall biosynthesis
LRKILIVSKYFYPFESGSEKTTRYIIDYLAKQDYRTVLFCAKGGRDKLNKDAVFYTMEKNKIYSFLSKKRFLKEFADIFIGGANLLKIFLKEKIDVVNIHYSEAIGVPAVVLSKIFNKKCIVLWPTSSLYHSKKTDGKLSFISSKFYSSLCDVFLAKGMPSEQMRKYFKVKKQRLFETVNPVEQKDYDPGECDYNAEILGIYYLGKYNDFKRPEILIKAIDLLSDFYKKKVRVSLYGNGPYENMIKDIVKEKKLESIVFINPPTKNVKEVIKENHIFVYPSLYEPAFSQSILESLGSGRIVICRKTKGITKYFKSDSIVAISPMNERVLADAIMRVLDNREECRKIARRAKSIISETFSFDSFMAQFLVHL